jgi:hypothetical protein
VGQPSRVSPGLQLPSRCDGDLGAHPFPQKYATKSLALRSRVVAPSQRILISMPLRGDNKTRYLLCRQLVFAGAPSGRMNLATGGTRQHPGGGAPAQRKGRISAGRHRRPKAEEAEARGKPPPQKTYYLFKTLSLFPLSPAFHSHISISGRIYRGISR